MSDAPKKKNNSSGLILIFFALFLAVDFFVWSRILFAKAADETSVYFLNVGQGDAELVILPGNLKILTDSGPDSKIIGELEKIPSLGDRYIDIAIISHPQLDHFNGFRHIIDRYRVGAFIYNGRSDNPGVEEWPDLVKKINERGTPLIQIGAGDKIKYSVGRINFLSPNPELLQSAELNDTGLVELIESNGLKILLTADIGAEIEKYLADNFDLRADILKVPHHGSRFSSSDFFLKAVKPKVAIIEVGSKNSYGHPTQETLRRLSNISSAVFRTDNSGQITASVVGEKLKIFTSK
ncbi:MAG: MBL fold metallo-hydrolase [bacterium]|nr:MBL fold metallo-hydrolase [bacterium]